MVAYISEKDIEEELAFQSSNVWKNDNHIIDSDYRGEVHNVRAYQAWSSDPKNQNFKKLNGASRTWSKEEVRKENCKRGYLKRTFTEWCAYQWQLAKNDWNNPRITPKWYKWLLVSHCTFTLTVIGLIAFTDIFK